MTYEDFCLYGVIIWIIWLIVTRNDDPFSPA